jgi:radical SAM superfamily enzyme YgiQ (UPF0313 family)
MIDKDSIYPPMSLGIIAALTPEHWDVEIHDENFVPFEYTDADLVGFTSLTATINRCYEIASEYKKNKIPTVIGGIHASMLPEEAIQYVDSVVIGEAENIWAKVIIDFENNRLGKYYKSDLPLIVNSPAPRIDLYHPDYKFGSVQTTRGCPMNCEFCSVHIFNGSQYRLRSIEKAVEDFAAIDKEHIYIVDDNFVGYNNKARKHAIDFFREIVKQGIRKNWVGSASMNIANDEELLESAAESGCRLAFLGIESELVDQLEETNKKINLKIGVNKFQEVYDKIHKYGMGIIGAFIFGLDSDTPDTLFNRTNYILSSDIDSMQTSILTPLPGTILFNRLQEEGRLLYTNFPEDWERYNFTEVVHKPKSMYPDEFKEAVHACWEKLYDMKNLKKKFLNTLKLTKNATTATWAFSSNLHYHNIVFEEEKDLLNIEKTFPQLTVKIEK